jgi:hypothetical protein
LKKLRYLDFDLKIEREGDRYCARILSSPAGEASHVFDLPFSDRLENLVLKIGHLRGSTRRVVSNEMEAARELGTKLFDTVFGPEVRACLRTSLERTQLDENAGLRLKLRLQEVPELGNLPWEFIYDSGLFRFFAQSDRTPVVRYIEIPEKIRPLKVQLPLRVLVMISSPKDYTSLNSQRERSLLEDALKPLGDKVQVDWMDGSTLQSLLGYLRAETYHIFHFIGHGGFDEKAEEGVLVLEDQNGRGLLVGAERLATILHGHRSLRLVVLNSCEGARNSRTDPFAGVAATLIQQSVPAVVAMQFEISDDAAGVFAGELYSALVAGLPIDSAVTQARLGIYSMPNDVEWGTPVLYMRSPDGTVFDVEPPNPIDEVVVPEPPKPKSLANKRDQVILDLKAKADEAIHSENWMLAVQKLFALRLLDPTNEVYKTAVAYVNKRREVAELYSASQEHLAARRWKEALLSLQRVNELNPGYKDTRYLIAEAERHSKNELIASVSSTESREGESLIPSSQADAGLAERKDSQKRAKLFESAVRWFSYPVIGLVSLLLAFGSGSYLMWLHYHGAAIPEISGKPVNGRWTVFMSCPSGSFLNEPDASFEEGLYSRDFGSGVTELAMGLGTDGRILINGYVQFKDPSRVYSVIATGLPEGEKYSGFGSFGPTENCKLTVTKRN